jgi:hypothetical protein
MDILTGFVASIIIIIIIIIIKSLELYSRFGLFFVMLLFGFLVAAASNNDDADDDSSSLDSRSSLSPREPGEPLHSFPSVTFDQTVGKPTKKKGNKKDSINSDKIVVSVNQKSKFVIIFPHTDIDTIVSID